MSSATAGAWEQPLSRAHLLGGSCYTVHEPLGLFTYRLNLNVLICKVGTKPPIPEA